jgi:hypothetical protein
MQRLTFPLVQCNENVLSQNIRCKIILCAYCNVLGTIGMYMITIQTLNRRLHIHS